jgi:1,6-anhydro-N-acetylmuramate kinase
MTGSSVDGLDLALVEARGKGLAMRARMVRHVHRPLGDLGPRLARFARQAPCSALEIGRMARELGERHAAALLECLSEPERAELELVAVHGQTVAHRPDVSWALFDPAALVASVDCAIVGDLRLVDRAHGGEGAPITPLADWILFRSDSPRAIVNLGGFANVTRLPNAAAAPDQIRGGDVCPCNQLLDGGARRFLDAAFDVDGVAAAGGRADEAIAGDIARQLLEIAPCGRSLGTSDEGLEALERVEALGPADALATLCRAVAGTIAGACGEARDVLLFGGGTRNRALVAALREALAERSVAIGTEACPAAAREAAAMAVLGLVAADGVALTFPEITGRGEPQHRFGRWILPR